MDKQTYENLSYEESTRYLNEATAAELEELFRNGALEQDYYDLVREARGMLPEKAAEALEKRRLKIRRQMAYFA